MTHPFTEMKNHFYEFFYELKKKKLFVETYDTRHRHVHFTMNDRTVL